MKEPQAATSPFKMTETVKQFINEARKYGVSNLFQPDELIMKNNMGNVFACIHNLAETVKF